MSNRYGYGPVDGPITPRLPIAATHPKLRLRAELWNDALAAHRARRPADLRARATRRAAQLDFRPRLRAHARNGRGRRAGLRPGLVRANQPAADHPAARCEVRRSETTRYQFTRPFVLDASATTEAFSLTPVALDDALRDAADRLRS